MKALFRQHVRCCDHAARRSARDQHEPVGSLARHIDAAVFEDISVAEHGLTIRIEYARGLAATHRYGDVAGYGGGSTHDAVGLVGVGRHYDFPSEQLTEGADVVQALVRLPILAHVYATVRQNELHGRAVDVVETLLVVGLIAPEHPEVGPERKHVADGQGACHGGGVVLPHATLHEALRVLLAEGLRLHRDGQVTVEDHYRRIRIGIRKVHQCSAPSRTVVRHLVCTVCARSPCPQRHRRGMVVKPLDGHRILAFGAGLIQTRR